MELPEHLHAVVDQLGQALVAAMVSDPECQALVARIQAEGYEVALMLEATVAIQRRKDLEAKLEGPEGALNAPEAVEEKADQETQTPLPHVETKARLFGDVLDPDPTQKSMNGENFSEADKAFLRTFKISLD